MANPNYGGGSAASIAARGLAYAVEIQAQSKWEQLLASRRPLLAMIRDKKLNWNTAYKLGPKITVPVWIGADTNPVVGVPRGAQTTPTTLDQSDGTAAEYQITHYRGGILITSADQRLYQSGDTIRRGNLVDGRTQHLMKMWDDRLAIDLAANAADSETAVMGIPYPLASASVVGGIDQATNARWRARVVTGIGTLTMSVLNTQLSQMNLRGANTDLILCSANPSGNDVYNRVRSFMDANTYYVKSGGEGGTVQYGFDNYVYRGALVAQDPYLPANELYLLDTSTWGFFGDMGPKLHHTEALAGTDVVESIFHMFCSLYITQPRLNCRLTGITA